MARLADNVGWARPARGTVSCTAARELEREMVEPEPRRRRGVRDALRFGVGLAEGVA